MFRCRHSSIEQNTIGDRSLSSIAGIRMLKALTKDVRAAYALVYINVNRFVNENLTYLAVE